MFTCTIEQAKNLVKGGVTTSVVTMIIVAAGSVIMSNIASNDIAQEVSDAS
jgi:TRAP-type C4-dicarboxylate transport system permease large subunit